MAFTLSLAGELKEWKKPLIIKNILEKKQQKKSTF